jgi:hypothetical protein
MIRQALNLEIHHFRQKHGDLEVFGSWYTDEEGLSEPCIVILPTFRSAGRRVTPCVVRLSNAWIYTEEEYGTAEQAAKVAFEKAEATAIEAMIMAAELDLNPLDPRNCIRITSIIRDHLGDLLSMPPRPQSALRVAADVIRTDLDGNQTHAEILDDV